MIPAGTSSSAEVLAGAAENLSRAMKAFEQVSKESAESVRVRLASFAEEVRIVQAAVAREIGLAQSAPVHESTDDEPDEDAEAVPIIFRMPRQWCPACGSENLGQTGPENRAGQKASDGQKFKRFKCKACGRGFRAQIFEISREMIPKFWELLDSSQLNDRRSDSHAPTSQNRTRKKMRRRAALHVGSRTKMAAARRQRGSRRNLGTIARTNERN